MKIDVNEFPSSCDHVQYWHLYHLLNGYMVMKDLKFGCEP
jgi:hypothetical protein